MPRYFFHVTDNKLQLLDIYGDLCDNEGEVRDNAIEILVQMAEDELPDGDQHDFGVEVTDESGDLIFSAELELRSRWTKRDQPRSADAREPGPTGP